MTPNNIIVITTQTLSNQTLQQLSTIDPNCATIPVNIELNFDNDNLEHQIIEFTETSVVNDPRNSPNISPNVQKLRI